MKMKELAISIRQEPLELVYNNEVKIRDIKDQNSIIELLNYLYVLLNIKKVNQLNALEESVLNGVILTSYRHFTINEIKHAFRLAVSGFLKIEMYQKLDSITFGKVMMAYNDHKLNKIKEHKKTIKPDNTMTIEEKEKIEELYKKNCIIPYFDKRKTATKPIINWQTYSIFNHFWNKKAFSLSKDEVKKYKEEAAKTLKNDLINKRTIENRIDINKPLNKKDLKMYASCIALYYKSDDILNHVRMEFEGWNDKL